MAVQREQAQAAPEQHLKGRRSMLSVIIPTNNESDNSFFVRTLQSLSQFKEIEVICIDKSEALTRAERLNIGFQRAQGSMILFHHPRSFLVPEGIQYLIENKNKKMWGGFTHKFDVSHPLLKFTSWYSNRVRGQRLGVVYLDHCIFFHRSLWLNPLPAIEIFEDTVLSQNFNRQLPIVLLPFVSETSAVRFAKNGLWKQSLMNQILKIGFHLGVSHDTMNRIYERGLNLNSKS